MAPRRSVFRRRSRGWRRRLRFHARLLAYPHVGMATSETSIERMTWPEVGPPSGRQAEGHHLCRLLRAARPPPPGGDRRHTRRGVRPPARPRPRRLTGGARDPAWLLRAPHDIRRQPDHQRRAAYGHPGQLRRLAPAARVRQVRRDVEPRRQLPRAGRVGRTRPKPGCTVISDIHVFDAGFGPSAASAGRTRQAPTPRCSRPA